ncbi:MAG TPA: SDR family oxidoreductase [Burkholderiales bacterium]|nr:SDR family oxidoreductase [Burkholderiales bacterium]
MSGVAIVTGSGRGIGAATAKLAARRGYAVCVNYLKNEARADAVVAEIRAGGGRAIMVQADTAIEEEVLRLFERVDLELGPVTALVNNAGITGRAGRLDSFDAAAIRRVLEVNVTGAIYCSQQAVKRMSTRNGGAGGAIVNVSSLAAKLGGANQWIPYAAAKGAVNSFTIGLAKEVAAEGIRVNAISPGLIATEIHAEAGLADRLQTVVPMVPMGRLGTAEECAEAILWLLSGEAAYMIGGILTLSGGR